MRQLPNRPCPKNPFTTHRTATICSAICVFLSLGIIKTSSSAPAVEKRYFNSSNNSGGINVSGRNNKVVIYCPRGFKEAIEKDANSIIVGKFKTINANIFSKARGVKMLNFRANGRYDFYEKGKLTRSGIYRVGVDPLRKGERRVAVLEGAGPLWVRIDSRNRINYEQMNYDRM